MDKSRRDFLKTLGILTTAASLRSSLFGNQLRAQKQPNIVFILVDDLGVHEMSCYGNTYYESPNIDKLAKEGMLFTDAYAACPVCSPTRASIMTGKYPARLHLTDYIPGAKVSGKEKLLLPEWVQKLMLDEITIAEALKEAGYSTGHFGKWHLNIDKNYFPDRPGDPGSQGFDDVLTTVKPKSSDDPYKDPHHVEEITSRAISFIERNKSNPFFCYVAHHSIHSPKMERKELIDKYAAKEGSEIEMNIPKIGAMVESLDKSIGRIMDKLDELNLSNDTIVIYFSDNGCSSAKEYLKPLRGGKAQLYEGGIREPMIIRWPGVVEVGSTCSVPVSSIDFFPTLLSVVGIKNKYNVDGVDIMPLLKGYREINRDAIYWHYPHYHPGGIAPSGAIRAGDYKLIEWFEKSVEGTDKEGALELYDLKNDISEQKNLIKKKPEVAEELYKKLLQWRTEVNAQMMQRNPGYVDGYEFRKAEDE